MLTFLFACGFAAIHVFIGAMRFLAGTPRSRWLSGAGGVAVAYIFLHILPELAAHQRTFSRALELPEQAAESLVYLVALAGLATFYGLERAAKASRTRSRAGGRPDAVEAELFWLHMGSFALYNILIGYLLLHREEAGFVSLLIYFVAMALHFVTNDYGLREDHKDSYDHRGRWIIAVAVLGGWALGAATEIPEVLVGFLFAFLAGGVILNVLKEELPEERQSNFAAFALGTAGYALILLAA
ncbi:MAG: hypothetical protein FJX25_09450 [Alphaproteobacteria bacterium]|nr:hypothetical protein [Alphaproteobacteria bacterium]